VEDPSRYLQLECAASERLIEVDIRTVEGIIESMHRRYEATAPTGDLDRWSAQWASMACDCRRTLR
jgi:hypothetical protein